MSFSNFKGIWQVKDDPAPTGEESGHRIAIGGRPHAVKIVCIDAEGVHEFGEGKYLDSNQISVSDASGLSYLISLTRGEPHDVITCKPSLEAKGGGNPGSWTADDNIGRQDGSRHS